MRLWADIYDASDNRLGEGPITSLKDASITRVLDGVGTVRFSVPLGDQRARDLLQHERRARVYIEQEGATRELGRGIVRNLSLSVAEGGYDLTADGPDDLDELKRVNTLLARTYSGVAAAAIAEALVALVPGWSVTASGPNVIGARYDGASIFKALSELAADQGLHVRAGGTSRTLEFGAFGSNSGLRIAQRITGGYYGDDNVLHIEKLSLEQTSEDVVNWLVPLGQGQGEAALTLAQSTRTTPYIIQQMTGPSGKTISYISDTASIASFGQIQKVATWRQIGAVSNSDADLQVAANALYDAGAAWLQRNATRLDSYRCTVRRPRITVRPGDKIRLTYKGIVERDGTLYTWLDIDADVWVMKVTERFTLSGAVLDLQLATVDRHPLSGERMVIGMLDNIQINELRVQTYPSVRSFVYSRDLAPSFNARVPILFTDATTALNRCKVNIVSRPFRSNVAGAASGGGQTTSSGGSSTPTSGAAIGSMSQTGGVVGSSGTGFPPGGNHTHYGSVFAHTHNITIAAHTHTVGDHTHPVNYGIFDDSARPDAVSLWIDGVDRSSPLGGPWAVGGGAIDVTLDITQFLQSSLRTRHQLEFRCTSGQGEIELTVEIYETIQAIAVS